MPARVAVALRPEDEPLVDVLTRNGFVVVRCALDTLEAVLAEGVSAVVADADLAGMLSAVARLRRQGGALAALPVLVLGEAGERVTAHVDAVQAGADAFLPRPVTPQELTGQLRSLLDAPGRARRDAGTRPPLRLGGLESLSFPLAAVLRAAVHASGTGEEGIDLPDPGDESPDDLVPHELLEPLDAPLDAFAEEITSTAAGIPVSEASGSIGLSARRNNPARPVQPTPVLTPLPVGGDLRLSGTLGRSGVAELFSAAARARATGLLVIRDGLAEWQLALSAGHLMALRGSRPEDQIGPLLVRLGVVPREAARFAAVPLDAGPRGAAVLAARGYIAPDALALALARAAQEVAFDLVCLPHVEWDMRPLESAVGIPLPTRSMDALLVLAARARIEPEEAWGVLGGDGATVSLRSDAAALTPLPLSPVERAAATGARGTLVASLVRTHGTGVLPALAALFWLQHLRAEGPAHEPARLALGPVGPERTRVRALAEVAARRDVCALLGVSEWATRAAAQAALDARRAEVDALRVRYPVMEPLASIQAALDEAGALVADGPTWERYVSSLRGAGSRDGP